MACRCLSATPRSLHGGQGAARPYIYRPIRSGGETSRRRITLAHTVTGASRPLAAATQGAVRTTVRLVPVAVTK